VVSRERLICPGCGEPAQERPPAPSAWTETTANTGREVPRWSHLDGEPLCPEFGPHGYQPAQPDRA
jgi:hypothetical protein